MTAFFSYYLCLCLQLKYDFLVVAMGLQLNYDQVCSQAHRSTQTETEKEAHPQAYAHSYTQT